MPRLRIPNIPRALYSPSFVTVLKYEISLMLIERYSLSIDKTFDFVMLWIIKESGV